MRKHNESVRIAVQLVDVSTNRQIWGNTYKGELADIFDIQEQVAKQIVEALKLKLTFPEKVSLTKRSTVNAQAYDLFLRGQDYLYRLNKRAIEHAIKLFEAAIELDPRYAAAYAGASSAYGMHYQWFGRLPEYREKAQELSFKALMYDSTLASAYSAMGLSYFIWGTVRGSQDLLPEVHRAGSGRLRRVLDAGAHPLLQGRNGACRRAVPQGHADQAGFLHRVQRPCPDLREPRTDGRSYAGARATHGHDAAAPAAQSG